MATRCTTSEQFIETFHRFCDEQSFFVATMNMRPVGLETPFSIQLADKTPVLRGLCVVIAAWTTSSNPYKRPGIRLGIRRLTPESEAVFYQLQAMRTATPQEIVMEASEALTETPVPVQLPPVPTAPRVSPPARKPVAPTPRAGSVISVPPKTTPSAPVPVVPEATTKEASEPVAERTPGSDLVLPANPLQGLDDRSLGGFVDCTLYEETGNFFRAMDDGFEDEAPPIAPPKPAATDTPTFKPALSFTDEPADDPTLEKRPATATVEQANPFHEPSRAEPMPLPAPPMPIENDNSVKASLARVEHSVAKLLDAVDTSRPIDIVETRATPLPAGEAYARQVAKTRSRSRSKWLIVGGGVIAATAAAVLVLATRTTAEEETPNPAKPAGAPVVAENRDRPTDLPEDKPIADAPKDPVVDGDELAAVTAQNPNTPSVGEGPCKVEVKTTPAGTMVQLDGQTIGPSPVTIAGPCTKRRVDLVHPRYKAEQRWVTPSAGAPSTVDVTLVRPTHTLLVTSNPSGATVLISGRRAGTTPTKVPLMGFSGLEVKIEKTGYESVTKRIYSKVPQDKLAVTLKRALFYK